MLRRFKTDLCRQHGPPMGSRAWPINQSITVVTPLQRPASWANCPVKWFRFTSRQLHTERIVDETSAAGEPLARSCTASHREVKLHVAVPFFPCMQWPAQHSHVNLIYTTARTFSCLFYFLGGVRLSALGASLGWWWWVWSSQWNENWQEKPKYSEKTCSSATLSTTDSTWLDLGSNPDRRGGKRATNRLSYGTVYGDT
jgi:hypothetical protein